MKVYKKVKVKGLAWSVLSANERACSFKGRHFFALRCHSKMLWSLTEHDCDITSSSDGARQVGYLEHRLPTPLLSNAVIWVVHSNFIMEKKGNGEPLNRLTKDATLDFVQSFKDLKL